MYHHSRNKPESIYSLKIYVSHRHQRFFFLNDISQIFYVDYNFKKIIGARDRVQ